MPNQLKLEGTARAPRRLARNVRRPGHGHRQKINNSTLLKKIIYKTLANFEMNKKAQGWLNLKTRPIESPKYSYRTKLILFQCDTLLKKTTPKPSCRTLMIRNEFLKLAPEDVPLISKRNKAIWHYLKLRQTLRVSQVTVHSDEVPSGGKSDESPSSKGMLSCCVCADRNASLRCPACLQKYCKLACFKAHKDGNMCKVKTDVISELPADVPATRQFYFPTKDTVSGEQLEKLSSGKNLDRLKEFLKSKMIKDAIAHLNKTTNPVEDFRKVMANEDFVKFSDFVLTVLKK